MSIPELLAPCGSFDALKAALSSGADAVYLGGAHFNARRGAANFDQKELERAINFAHRHRVRVYVTVNTLVAEDELDEAARFLNFLYAAGADAVIVQDVGIALLVKELFPGMELHASTQMTIHAPAGASFLKAAGFKRVVLARELSLEEIAEVRSQSGLEVEVFVHGALCISYSGQCLFSSLIGGRSGNRGLCAQPCRLPYQLVDARGREVGAALSGRHLLSTRDLNLSGCLVDLLRAGVDALKIEGRLRRPEYVATVVRIYRRLLDRAVSSDNFHVEPEEERELTQVFNRDFTRGYLYGRPGAALVSWQRPNNRGLYLGRVTGYDRGKALAGIALSGPLAVGDGIEIWVSRGGRVGTLVDRMWLGKDEVACAPGGALVQVAVRGDICSGDRVFKTHDAALAQKAGICLKQPDEVELSFTVELKKDFPVRLVVEDASGHRGEALTEVKAAAAEKHPLEETVLREQLGRLGDTPYRLKDLQIRGEKGLMVPLSQLNRLRRAALADLEKKAWGRRQEIDVDFLKESLSGLFTRAQMRKTHMPALSVAVTGYSSLQAALTGGADMIYLSDELRFVPPLDEKTLFSAADLCRKQGVKLALAVPVISHAGEYARLSRLFRLAVELGLEGVLVTNPGPLIWARKCGLKTFADFTLHCFNSAALGFWQRADVAGVTLQPELTLDQVRQMAKISPLPLEALVHGVLPMMVSAFCPLEVALGASGPGKCPAPCREDGWGLKDRKDEVFALITDRHCRMHLYNGRDLSMYDHLATLAQSGVAGLRVEARARDERYVETVTRIYRRALDRLSAGDSRPREEERLTLASLSPAGLTRGHYFRGVQ